MVGRDVFRRTLVSIATLLVTLFMVVLPTSANAPAPASHSLATLPGSNSFGAIRIPVYGLQLELDTRPDLDGLQTSMTAVKDYPTGIRTLVGQPGLALQPPLPPGAVVKAELTGPAYGDDYLTIEGPANGLMELPNIQVAGDYGLRDVRLEDGRGNVMLRRHPGKDRIRIKVIKKLLVTQVTSRALTLDEIEQKGIVIDEKNFSAVNFTVGLTLGSEKVEIDMPIAIPTAQAEMTKLRPPDLTRLPSVQQAFDRINIPNFSLSGFQMKVPPDLEETKGIELPPINGVIVIPGNIGFLNQFFSVILQASNIAPDGSQLILREAKASIALPKGKDDIKASGDDPLRVAETRDHGIQEVLPLLDAEGQDSILPQSTNQAEFLVEGLSEGTHRVDFDISGDLYIPQLGKTVPMTGAAGGVVQVRNPTFNITLAHPDVVREGEAYSIFATVTNTSSSPANLFQLGLNTRSMSGAHIAEDEEDLKKLESLGPGQAETFEFKLVAMTTGEVTGTVFLADEGINGSFILTTGVGDTGIPLSPDTLVLPKEARDLPQQPDLLFQAVRLLGQAYSVATAPAGTLPPEIPRMRKGFVFDQAVTLAQAGLRTRFGQSALSATRDIAMDYFGADILRLAALYPEDEAAQARRRNDLVALDVLRRLADAGHDFSEVLGQMLAAQMTNPAEVARLQADWAEVYASRPAHLSFGVSSQGPPPILRISDADGNALGRPAATEPIRRDLPFAARLPLFSGDDQSATLMLLTVPESDSYRLEFESAASQGLRTSLIVPTTAGMEQVVFPAVELDDSAHGVVRWQRPTADSPARLLLELDTDSDGRADRTLEPETRVAVVDRGPRLLGVRQWAKGAQPNVRPSFERGDPLGRMFGVLYDEAVDPTSATDPANYQVEDNEVLQIAVQPDGRLLFMVLERPVGPFVERELRVNGVNDQAGNSLTDGMRLIAPDPERGIGGRFRGQVVHADGRPVPFAAVKYIQPLEKQALLGGGCLGDAEVRDAVITTYEADREGRFSIDYVLQAAFPEECPDNVDVWLNEHSPPGTQNFKLEATDPQTGEIGKVSTRMHFDGQSMGLKVVIRGYGTIKGKAVTEDGTPIVGGDPGSAEALWVRARNISTGEWFSTWVDADGHYSFPREFDADNGKRTEVPRMPTGNVILQLVRPSDGYTAVTTVNLPGGGATVTQDLLMIAPNRYSRVSGRVLEADGVTGAANVKVQIAGEVLSGMDLYNRHYSQAVVGSIHTDKDGNFAFDQVPTGAIDIRAFRQATYEQARVESRLDEGSEQSLVLIFPGTGGSVRGLVRDAHGNPVAGATVAGGPTLTEADDDGFFEIRGLPLGKHKIYAQGKDSPALGTVDVQTLGPKDVQQVVITLQPLGSIAGTVYQADGKTLIRSQRVQLWAEPDKGVLAETLSDEKGGFRFEKYPLGKYSVRAVKQDHGDGGMTYTSLRYAGDVRDADIRFRGLGEIRGRVVQSNGTPVLSDVIATGKVWRIISSREDEKGDVFMEFVRSVQSQVDEGTARQIEGALQAAGLSEPPSDFFMLVDESRLIASDIKGPNGEVTGRFQLSNALAGSYKLAAFGPFLAPAEQTVAIPRTVDAKRRRVDAGDVVLEPATGKVAGTVYMPDGKTPVGADVTVKIRSLDSSGSVMTATGGVSQPVLPEYSVTTDGNGRYAFPLVLRGRFNLTADTGTPPRGQAAKSASEIRTDAFNDADGERQLNVRLYGSTNGVVPAGETLQADIRLLDAAGVRLRVVENDGETPVPFAQVGVRTESSLDVDEESAMAKLFADKAGYLDLFPLIEGRFSVHAKQPLSPARGRTEGLIEQGMMRDGPLAATLTLGAVTTAAGQVVKAEVFGHVNGQVLKADGSVQTNPVQVTVKAGGASLLATTDDQGRFQLDDVPGGGLQIEAFEPFTARRAVANSQLREQDEIISVTLRLIGLGTVSGTVLSSDGSQKMSGLDVLLYPSGRFSDRLISRSDMQGLYELPGVPIGRYRVEVKDYENGLTGQAEGKISADDERRTSDVLLEPTGQIIGTVYAAGVRLNERGEPLAADGTVDIDAPRATRATVILRGAKTRLTLQTDEQGRFASNGFLPLGKYHVTATPQAGNDGIVGAAELTQNGERKALALALAGHGSLRGAVLDSAGEQPVKAARLEIRSRSPFSPGILTRFTKKDGSFAVDELPVGEFEIEIKTTIAETELGASLNGRIDSHGQEIVFSGDTKSTRAAIRLQPAGSVRGRVVHDDGVTPVSGAVVELSGGKITLGRETDADGQFRFDTLPLGDYRIGVLDPVSNGVATLRPSLKTNGQAEVYDAVTLDSRPPRVIATEPKANTVGVDGGSPIRVRFSEPMDPESISTRTFRVLVEGAPVRGNLMVDDDRQGVTFVPSRALPDLKQVQVRVKGDTIGFEGQVVARGIRDEAGVGLNEDLTLVYTTRDATPPQLIAQSPLPDAKGVGLDQVIRLEFSEEMDAAALQGLRLLQDGKSLAGRLDIPTRQQGRLLVFTPRRRLSPNASFVVQSTGPVIDLAGNPLPGGGVDFRFDTLDTKPPSIRTVALAPDHRAIEGKRVTVTAELDAAADVAVVEFYINRKLVGSATESPWSASVYLDPALGREPVVEALARDTSGNSSARYPLSLQVASNTPPSVRLVGPGTSQVSAGQVVGFQVIASDDVGLTQIAFNANRGGLAGQREAWDRSTSAQTAFGFKIPADHPIGSDIELLALATDTQGLVAASAPLRLSVVGKLPPEVFIDSPDDGTAVDPGSEVSVTLHAEDATGIIELALNGTGLMAFSEVEAIEPPEVRAEKTLKIRIPDDASATETLTLAARALDSRRNAGNRSIHLRINDRIAPVVTLVKNWGDRERVEPGSKASLRVESSDEIGIDRYEIRLAGETLYEKDVDGLKQVNEAFDVVIPKDISLAKELALTAHVQDTSGNIGASDPLLQKTSDLTRPTLSIESSLAKNTQIRIGEKLVFTLKAEDLHGLSKVSYTISGLIKEGKETLIEDAVKQIEQKIELTIPDEAKVGGEIRVNWNVWDRAGNHRNMSHAARVFDQVRPQLAEISPPDGEQNAIPDARLTFRFSEYLDRGSVNSETLPITGPDGIVKGRYSFGYYRPDIVYFQPEAPLQRGVEYQIRFTAGITDPTGNKLQQERVTKFVTDNTNPALVEQYPANKAEGIPTKPVIRLRFDEKLKRNTLGEETVRLIDGNGDTVPTERRIKDGDKLIELTPRSRLKLDTVYRIVVSGAITDLAGNPIVADDGKTFKDLTTDFTTGALVFVSPATGQRIREDTRFPIQISGEGMDIADVVYEVNGRRLPPVSGPDFREVYLAPQADQLDRVEILAIARDREQKVIARRRIVAPVTGGLRLDPPIIGIEEGGRAKIHLRLPRVRDKAVDVVLTLGDDSIARLVQSKVSIPPGQHQIAVEALGLAQGNTWLQAKSDLGRRYVGVSVSEPVAGRPLALASSAVAVSIGPPSDGLPQDGVVHAGIGIARIAYEQRPPISLPHLGEYDLGLPIAADRTKDRTIKLYSADTDIVTIRAQVSIEAGRVSLPVKVHALAPGSTWMYFRTDDRQYRVPLEVQSGGNVARRGIVSMPLGLAVGPSGFDKRLHLSQLGKRSLAIPLLSEPSPVDLPVRITSDNPDVLTVVATSQVLRGAREALVEMEALSPGNAVIRLRAGQRVVLLAMNVIERGDGLAGVSANPPPGVSIAEPGSAGTLYMTAGNRQTWQIHLPGGADPSRRTATIKSRDPDRVNVETETVAVEAGSNNLKLTLVSMRGVSGETVLDVQLGNRTETIRVIVGGPDMTNQARPVLVSPALGIEVE